MQSPRPATWLEPTGDFERKRSVSDRPHGPRSPGLIPALLVACLLLFLSGCDPGTNSSTGVQVLLNTSSPEPSSTLQVRFDEPMVPSSAIGTVTSDLPLVISPAVPGKFAWTTSRSGDFAPDQPFKPGLTYRFRLADGLRKADGTRSGAILNYQLVMPPFGVVELESGAGRIFPYDGTRTNAASLPVVKAKFNLAVEASAVAGRASFVNSAGAWVSARVRQGGRNEEGYGFYQRLEEWQESSDLIAELPDEPVPEMVILWPSEPLSVGAGWKLVLDALIPSADRSTKSPVAFEHFIGDIQPFVVARHTVEHQVHRQPKVNILFSKQLPDDGTNLLSRWIEVTPKPEELRAESDFNTLSISGKWLRGIAYNVVIKRGLPARVGLSLATNTVLKVEVPPVPPRLYFPVFATDQFAYGKRSVPLIAVNVAAVRVRAKQLQEHGIIHTLQGYDTYTRYKPWTMDGHPGFTPLNYELVPGKTVVERVFVLPNKPDEASELSLDWNDLLGGEKRGTFFIEAERVADGNSPRLGTQAIVQLTDLGLIWKNSDTGTDVMVFSYQTGLAVTNASVRVYTSENELLSEAVTDAQGVAAIGRATNAAWLAATVGDDLHAVRINHENINRWWFADTRWSPDISSEPVRVALFADRDVYRPGETVHLKAIARQMSAAGLEMPKLNRGKLTFRDPRGRPCLETNIVLSQLGSFEIPYVITRPDRGDYAVELTLGETSRSVSFSVADFEPAAFEIQMEALPAYAHNQSASIPLTARYLFGKSLDRAQVTWWISGRDSGYTPAGFEDFRFQRCEAEARWSRTGGTVALSGKGELSAREPLKIDASIVSNLQAPQPRTVELLAEVTDLNQQTISRSVQFTKHSSDFYLGIRQVDQVMKQGESLRLEVVAVGADGQPWSKAVKAKVRLSRIDWESARLQGAGRSVRFRSEPDIQLIQETELLLSKGAHHDGNAYQGTAVENLISPVAGEYLAEVTARDDSENQVISSTTFNVSAESRLGWDYQNETEIKLVADRPVYAPGDTATLLIKTPISGHAWVTVETERVLHSFVAKLEGNAPSVRIPIQPTYAPNVYVSVTVVRGAADSPLAVAAPEFRVGYLRLRVEDPGSRLKVQLSSDKPDYLPGEPVSVDAAVLNHQGNPVAGAEVTLYAVDEGVLSLSDYQVPDLHSLLLAQRELRVGTGISVGLLMPEDPEQLRFQNKGYLGGGGGKEGIRQNFLSCAYWHGTLYSDDSGRVQARFNAPDGLTRYRVIAVVHTSSHQFGNAVHSISVHKPLMLQPGLPMFANVSDTLMARAVIWNETARPETVVASLELDSHATGVQGATLLRSLQVPARGSATVDFPVRFTSVGRAQWVWRAKFAESNSGFSDAVSSAMEIGAVMPLLRDSSVIVLTQSSANLLANLDPQILRGQGTITVRAAGSQLVTLAEAARELLHYPYGCAEQTGSSLLPWLLVCERPELAAFIGERADAAEDAARAGIQRLFSMQTGGGGLVYWPGQPSPMPWASAYGAFVLGVGRQAGLGVPEAEYNRLLAYVRETISFNNGADDDTIALGLAALALGGKPEPGLHTRLLERAGVLSGENRALLAFAMATAGESSETPRLLLRDLQRKEVERNPFWSPVRETAIRLLAAVACGLSAEADKSFEQLSAARKQGHWVTTQGNSWALLASFRYLQDRERGQSGLRGSLRWGSQTVELDSSNGSLVQHTFQLQPASAEHALAADIPAGVPLYLQVNVASRLDGNKTARLVRGFGLQRDYVRLNEQNEPEAFERLRVGDRVLVTLRLTVPAAARYVALEDPLPAVLEAVNPDFKTQQLAQSTKALSWLKSNDGDYWQSDFREMRADRVRFFADHVPPGNYVIRYIARVRTAGTATAPAAKVEEMYQPARLGMTDSQILISEPFD